MDDAATPTAPPADTGPAWPTRVMVGLRRHALLLVILAVAVGFRAYGLRWATVIHPDERQIIMTVERLHPGDMSPHFFAYGSLLFYLIWGVKEAWRLLFHHTPNLYYVARVISVVSSVLTVWLTYALGALCFERRAALLGAAFLAITALAAQNAHYGTVDSLLSLFLLAAVWFAARFARDGRRANAAVMLIATGLALATKVTALIVFPVLFWAYFRSPVWRGSRWFMRPLHVLFGLAVLMVLFVALQPYIIVEPEVANRHLLEQRLMVTGKIVYPFTIQFHRTWPVAYQLRDLVLFTFGPTLAVAAVIGLGPLLWNAIRRRLPWEHLPTLFCVLYLASVLPLYAKFARYMLPAAPILCLAAAMLLLRLAKSGPDASHATPSNGQRPAMPRLSGPPTVTVLVPAAVIICSLVHCAAYVAIFGKKHTLVRAEEWLAAEPPRGSRVLCENGWDLCPRAWGHEVAQTDHYQPDTPEKIMRLAQQLAYADYLVSASPRFYGSILRDPAKFPKTANYYVQLFSGRLGYAVEEQFEEPPRLLGLLQWRDDLGDESISVYDHPKVIVFRNVARLSAGEILKRINQPLLLDYFAERHNIMARRTTPGLAVQPVPSPQAWYAIHWWGVLFVWGWLVFPILFVLLPDLWDRGYSVCKAASVLLIAYLAWAGAAVGLTRFTLGWVVTAALLVGVVGIGFLVWAVRTGFIGWMRQNWRRIATIELAGVALFIMMLAFRACQHAEPGQGFGNALDGEKLMDMGFVNSLWRTGEVPPPDHWCAGERVNYYYFGHVMAAALAHASVADFDYRYNLADASFFTLALLGVFGLGINLTRRRSGGVWAVVLFAFMGNMLGVTELRQHLLYKRTGGLDGHLWSLWNTPRAIPGGITECPFFTMVYGDLHAHMLEMSLGTLALTVFLGLILRRRRSGVCLSKIQGLVAILGIGLLIGAIMMTNPWGLPTYGVLALLTLTWAFRGPPLVGWLRGPLVWLAAMAAAYTFATPFLLVFEKGPVGKLLYTPQPASPGIGFLQVFAIPLAIYVPYLLVRVFQRQSDSSAQAGLARMCTTPVLLGVAVVTVLWLFKRADFLALAVGATVLLSALLARLATRPDSSDDFPLILGIVAGGIMLGSELFHVDEYLRGDWFRVNTIMKFHHHALLLMAVANAYALRWLARRRPRITPWLSEPYLVGLITLLLCGAVTPLYGIPFRCSIPPGGPDLNAMADVRRLDESRYAAVRWLTYNAPLGSVIVEAVGGAHSDRGLVSAATGIPCVVNWVSHVFQWHHSWGLVLEREADVRRLYETTDDEEAFHVVEKYSIDWIVLGAMERQTYHIPQESVFERIFLRAFEYDDMVVYQVIPAPWQR